MRIITVEEHFEHPEVSKQVLQLSGPPGGVPLDELAEFGSNFNDDRDAAIRLGGASAGAYGCGGCRCSGRLARKRQPKHIGRAGVGRPMPSGQQ
jgi:hypothetical protein